MLKSTFRSIRKISITSMFLLTSSVLGATEITTSACEETEKIRPGAHKTWIYGTEAGDSKTLSIEVPTVSIGRFAIDSIDQNSTLRLEILDRNCKSLGTADRVEHIDVSDAAIEVAFRRPGTYRLRVSSVDSAESLGSFDLSSELVSVQVEDHWYSIDSDGLMARWSTYRPVGFEESREEEFEPDPDTLLPGGSGFIDHSREEEFEPDPDTATRATREAMANVLVFGYVTKSREEEFEPDPDTLMESAGVVRPLVSVSLDCCMAKSREEEFEPDPDTLLIPASEQGTGNWRAVFMADSSYAMASSMVKSREEEFEPDPDTLYATSEWVVVGSGMISGRGHRHGRDFESFDQELVHWLAELLDLTPASVRKGPGPFELLSFDGQD